MPDYRPSLRVGSTKLDTTRAANHSPLTTQCVHFSLEPVPSSGVPLSMYTSLSLNFLDVAQDQKARGIKYSYSIGSSHHHSFKFLFSSTSRQISTNYGPQLQQQHADHKGPPLITSETGAWTTSSNMDW
uniref:Uncharacterized protein n=1 Tax=Bursaphelenchus xylophilus TaxID=6326 RepID=A0A1I7S0S8_BURXY